ncbi:DUF3291 domain-containing protein [Pinibacter aurantiacus]|uniref:DUF3291 domain-containing protein n=1 Tax=Pinibacter aurantiacus TaxID=2851599 RepID=A0A9E2SGA1_9BACT|nr:DUF3291 domain-containing protein [Pinibacter aurantiacus]MBV4360010.1 DUF3291 domain-containing protein [Pinibacter aurantiacus]
MNFELAQVNIGRILGPMDSDVMTDFAANIDYINGLAESSDGFVWRLKDENNNATDIKMFDDEFLLVNMSVWKNVDTLFEFTYRTMHTEFLKRRKEWFSKLDQMHYALWYVPTGHKPTTAEAKERLEYIEQNGDTPFAFGFKNRFSVEDYVAFKLNDSINQ